MTPEERRETMEAACNLIAAGSLTTEAAQAVGINPATLWKWAESDPLLGKLYAQAKESAADALADEALRVARDSMGLDKNGVAAARLHVDTLKWAAAKRRPKEYGDKQQVEVSGGIEHLHLDALRQRTSARATLLPNLNTVNLLDSVEDVQVAQLQHETPRSDDAP